MSPLTLLMLATLIAALAFFAAGLLLARGGKRDEQPAGEVGPAETPRLRQALATAEQALADAQQRQAAEAAARREAERERDSARAEATRLASQETTLAERLRTAEDENRAAFKREEEAAEMWAGQLDAAKVGQKRHDQALEREVAELRDQLATLETARAHLAADVSGSATKAAAAAIDVTMLQARTVEAERRAEAAVAERERLAQAAAEAALRERGALERLTEVEASGQAKLAAAEASWQGRLAVAEAAFSVRLAATDELRARVAAAEAEHQARKEQIERDRARHAAATEERETLALRVRAAEEVAEQRRQEAVAAAEARRSAEAKLKDYERLAQENAELRTHKAEAEQAAQAQAGREVEAKDAKVDLAAAQAKLAELERITDENRRLRDEVAELRTHQEASAELLRLQATNKQARLEAELTARRLAELEHIAEENRGLRDEVAELRTHQEASGELERLQAAHKQVRLDAELMARRLQELLHERAELLPLRAQAAETAALAQEVEYLRRREKDLEAQIYAGGSFASRELPILSGELPVMTPGTDLEANLDGLVSKGGPRTAVLADAQGFLIASAGESVTQEGLAAFAAVAGELVARARMLLPLADIESIKVTDANRMVLSCHLFASAGEGLGVATLGPGEPPPADTARAIAGLAAIVGGEPVTHDTEEEDDPR